jgi:hypothetical protein
VTGLDLLRRVFIPRELPVAEGGSVFRTIDGQTYRRMADGSIRRHPPKVNCKAAKRARLKARRAAEVACV